MENLDARPLKNTNTEIPPAPGPSNEEMKNLIGKGRDVSLGEKAPDKMVKSELFEMEKRLAKKENQNKENKDREKELDEAEKMMAFVDTLDKSNPDAKFTPVEVKNVTPEQAEKGIQDQVAFFEAENVKVPKEKQDTPIVVAANNKDK